MAWGAGLEEKVERRMDGVSAQVEFPAFSLELDQTTSSYRAMFTLFPALFSFTAESPASPRVIYPNQDLFQLILLGDAEAQRADHPPPRAWPSLSL